MNAKQGGNKVRKQKNSTGFHKIIGETPVPNYEELKYIGKIIKSNGDCRFSCIKIDENGAEQTSAGEFKVILPPRAKKTGRITKDSYVLMELQQEGSMKGEISHVYSENDAEYLKNHKYISRNNDIIFSEEQNQDLNFEEI